MRRSGITMVILVGVVASGSAMAMPQFSATYLAFDTPGDPRGLVSGDFNGDSVMDLAIGGGGAVSIRLGNGDGTFAPRADIPIGSGIASITMGDLDADGNADLVVDGAVLLGHGDGTFTHHMAAVPVPIPSLSKAVGPPPSNGIGLGDFDENGQLDVVSIASAFSIVVAPGNGDGSFGPGTTYNTGEEPSSLVVVDLDRDGHLDVAVCNRISRTVSVFRGVGNGTFRLRVDYGTGDRPMSIAAGDLDGDGWTDLATANLFSQDVSVLRNAGDGSFSGYTSYHVYPGLWSVAIGDFNGDGHPDLAASTLQQSVGVLLNRGNGTFQDRVEIFAAVNSLFVASPDLNGDGHVDLLVTDSGAGSVNLLLGNGDNTFGSRVTYATGGGPASVAIGDLDEDGWLDLAVANNGYTVSVLLNRGDGSFAPRTDYDSGDPGPSALVLCDLNADHHLDVAVVNNYWPGKLAILLGQGDGTFAPRIAYDTPIYPNAISIGDLNGDEIPDISVSCSGHHELPSNAVIAVFRGNGDGTFAPRQDIAGGWHPASIRLGDLNADGKLDAVFGNEEVHRISVMLGIGDGTFGTRSEFGATGSPGALVLVDVNQDDKLDLIQGGVVLFGQGDGTFSSVPPGPAAAASFLAPMVTFNSTTIALGDLDGDRQLDLAATGALVAVYGGHGDGTFVSQAHFGTAFGPSSVAIADVSNDGRADLVVTNYNANSVSVLLNQGTWTEIEIADFEAWSTGGRVFLHWKLATSRGFLGVRVQRAASPEGPWAERTTEPLPPEREMSFEDSEIVDGNVYWYRLAVETQYGALDYAGPFRVVAADPAGQRTTLQVPFSQGRMVHIRYSIGSLREPMRLEILDVTGRRVRLLREGLFPPGTYQQSWDRRNATGTEVARGVYLLTLRTTSTKATRKFVLLHR